MKDGLNGGDAGRYAKYISLASAAAFMAGGAGGSKKVKDEPFSETGFTGNVKGLPSAKPYGIEEVLGYGDGKSFHGFFAYNICREAEVCGYGSEFDY